MKVRLTATGGKSMPETSMTNKKTLQGITASSYPDGYLEDENKRAKLAAFLYQCGVFWQRPISEELTTEWWELLKEYSEKRLEKAFKEYLRTGTVFPVPGLIIPILERTIG